MANTDTQNSQTIGSNKTDSSPETLNIDLRLILYNVAKYWFLFVLFGTVLIILAYTYLRYAVPVYKSNMTIMIKDESSGQDYSKEMIFKELGFESPPKKVQNELQIIRSRPLIEEVVVKLGLQVSYNSVGRVRDSDLYNNVISVSNFSLIKEAYGRPFFIYIYDKSGYKISDGIWSQDFKFDSLLVFKYGSLTLKLDSNAVEILPYTVQINFIPMDKTVRVYSERLVASSKLEFGNIIELSMEDPVPERGSDILKTLVEVYNQDAMDENNQMARNTLKFIDERLAFITEELSGVETNFENFRQRNKILGVPEEVNQLLNNISKQDEELSKAEIQVAILEGMESYLKKEENRFEFVPTNLNLNNLTLIPLLQSFNELLSQRNRLARVANTANPKLQELNEEIEITRARILESIRNIRFDLKITLDNFRTKNARLNQQINSIPRKEREFLEIKRQQNIKENLYLFLLQKREETALSQAMTVANARVVNPPLATEYPIRPRKRQVYLLALFIGLLIPTLMVYVLEMLKNTVESEKDIINATNSPFLGGIGFSKEKKGALVVTEKSRSAIAESFRALRTNLQFLAAGETNQVLLVTSSSSGEGKTFITLNLGMTFAIAQKKVVMVVMDLRKAKMVQYLKTELDTVGISNYLVGEIELNSIVQQTDAHPNLYVISSGPVPPNPAELLMSPKVKTLFEYLRANFDIIIVDTPPVGLVADALLLNEYIDSSIYIVRQNITQKGQLRIIEDLYHQRKFKKLGVLMNGIRVTGRYGYGYTYGYGYGYGYYDDSSRTWASRIRKIFSRKK